MGVLSRVIFYEISTSAFLGAVLFILVLFLQKAGQLFSILVNSTATPQTVGYLVLLLLPGTLPLTLPLGALCGVLIALNRMSSDGEITALRASGIPSRKVVLPVTVFAVLAMAATAFCSLWLAPWSNGEMVRVINSMGAAQLTAEIQPRIFEERFPSTVLYVGDVLPGQPVRWRPVFMADLSKPGEAPSAAPQQGTGPRVTIASEAIVVPDAAHNRLQLSLIRSNSYEAAPEPSTYYRVSSPKREQILEARERAERRAKLFTATPTQDLFAEAKTALEAQIELHQRFALPLACILLAILGVPLGVSSRKGGKSAAFVITVLFAFFYYMALISLIGLAREGRIRADLAVWLPNAAFAAAALLLLLTLERPGDRDLVGLLISWAGHHWSRLRTLFNKNPQPSSGFQLTAWRTRIFLLPQVIDVYILSAFLFYFTILLISLVLLTEIFNFFELLGDVFSNNIPMRELFTYLFFLAPKLIYDAAPLSALVAVLVTFGLLQKNNEITAMKACGISIYRLAMPALFAGLFLSGLLFGFDYYVVTQANLIQDALRNKIKGGPVQTFLDPNRKWIFGRGSRIFHYNFFNQEEGLLGNVSVYELNPASFQLTRHIYADRARWEPSLKTWIFQNGWSRDLRENTDVFRTFQGETATFPGIDEPPSWFAKQVKTYKQMNFRQLEQYMLELRQSGFNTIPLAVQFHKKFSVPLFVFVMVLVSLPFAFLTGNRSAMVGVGVSLGVATAYFALNYLFEQLGNVNLLPPHIAAWSPGAVFALAGVYLTSRMRT
jgi:LPS export ABC transporter permease LptG/LPS export ABC transporter permease LptF